MVNPQWEVVENKDGSMCHVRWSEPDDEGRYLWVSRYPATTWGRYAAERSAEDKNVSGVRPWEFNLRMVVGKAG